MAKRLCELYRPGDAVEVTFNGRQWIAAIVIKSDPPGMWVRDRAGQSWFVTNGRHIRAQANDE
jgi:hypothetical protein